MTVTTIEDVRALVGVFRRSDLRDLSVRAGGWTVFIAREGGGTDPLVASLAHVAPTPAAAIVMAQLDAPHAGIFRAACHPGDPVRAGQVVGRISVLGDDRPVIATDAGTIDRYLQSNGTFVELGIPLLRQTVV